MNKNSKNTSFKLSQEGVKTCKKELKRYETKRSSLIPMLYQVQKEYGWVPPETVTYLSELSKIPESYIEEVLQFYNMLNKKPVGRFHIQVCGNISCAMAGGRDLIQKLCKEFECRENELSPKHSVTISRVECLVACDQAPVVQVNTSDYGAKDFKGKPFDFIRNLIRSHNQ